MGARRWLLAAAGFLVALALMEALVRQLYWRPTAWHDELGGIPEPGSVQRFAIEGDGRSRWTDLRVRRAEPPDPRRPSILALGDSFSEALMTDDEEVYTRLLENALAARGIEPPVLNAGTSGYAACGSPTSTRSASRCAGPSSSFAMAISRPRRGTRPAPTSGARKTARSR